MGTQINIIQNPIIKLMNTVMNLKALCRWIKNGGDGGGGSKRKDFLRTIKGKIILDEGLKGWGAHTRHVIYIKTEFQSPLVISSLCKPVNVNRLKNIGKKRSNRPCFKISF